MRGPGRSMSSSHRLIAWNGLWKAVQFFVRRNRGRTLRQKVFSLLHATPHSGPLHRLLDNFIIACVLISVVSIILETVPELDRLLSAEFYALELFTVAVFSLEYVGRVYCACELPQYAHPIKGRLRYMGSISSLIDLLAIAPFFIGLAFHENLDMRFLRIFRLSRLLKVTRYTGTLNTLFKAVHRERRVLFASAFMMLLLVILTASLGFELEHDAQPDKFDSIPSAMYWAVITLASVGYGDVSPVTPLGKAVTMVISFIGIGIFAIPAGLMASAFTDQLRIDRETFENEFRTALADGKYSTHDKQALEAEAERLHLTPEDVKRIMAKVAQEVRAGESDLMSGLPPEILLEKYRQQLSHLQILALSAEAPRLDPWIADPGRTTPAERAVWRTLREAAQSAREPRVPPP